MSVFKIERLVSSYWRVTAPVGYANVKRDRDGWCADIRNNDGDFLQYAGVWGTKREAVEAASRVLERMQE